MIYGYARCSTNEELQDINRQIREVIQLGAGEENIYREYESGIARFQLSDKIRVFASFYHFNPVADQTHTTPSSVTSHVKQSAPFGH